MEIHLRGPLAQHKTTRLVSGPTTPEPQLSCGLQHGGSPGSPGPPPRGPWPRKETGPLVTRVYFSPFPTSSRHICDLSLCVLFIVWRPGLPANSELDRPSRGPRRPSQPSPERPPARALSAAPEPSRPCALARSVALYGTPGPVSPIVCPCLQPRCICLIAVWVTPQSGQGLHAILLRPLSSPGPWAPGLLVCHFTGFHPPATGLLRGVSPTGD